MLVRDEASGHRTDPSAWIDQHGDYLFRFALTRLRNQTIAEDLVQETLLSALRSMESFAGQSSERTWLVSILKHKIFDHYRKSSKEKRIEDVESLHYEKENLFRTTGEWVGHWTEEGAPVTWKANPEMLFENKRFWKSIAGCLSDLPERTAQVFVLREMDGLGTEEICRTLNITTSNLWVMLHRARMQLRRCLELKYFGKKEI
jgi:RNA polymerase sigma-70 factor (ECF subfamily)